LSDYQKAAELYNRAINILNKIFRNSHPFIISIYKQLGDISLASGDFGKAIELYQVVTNGIEETQGVENQTYVGALLKLSLTYYYSKNYELSEIACNRAVELIKKLGKPQKDKFLLVCSLYSLIYEAKGNFEKAFFWSTIMLEADCLYIDHIMEMSSPSEDEKLRYVLSHDYSLHHFLGLVLRHFFQDSNKTNKAFNYWLQRKGIVLDIQKKYYANRMEPNNSEKQALISELRDVRAKLSKITFFWFNIEDSDSYKNLLSELEIRKKSIEEKLNKINEPLILKNEILVANSDRISKVLPSESVLIDFALVHPTLQHDQSDNQIQPHYISFVFHTGKNKNISLIDLGEADRIDDLISTYKKEITLLNKQDTSKADATSNKLYNCLFRPLLGLIGKTKTVYISPDGVLNLIPFEVLKDSEGKYLIERFTFNYLATGRDLLNFSPTPTAKAMTKCFLMGAPDFGVDSEDKSTIIKRSKNGDLSEPIKRDSDLTHLSFVPLKYAKAELEAIRDVFPPNESEIYTGKNALEETLINADSPEFLHLATHGFFLGELELPGEGRGWQISDLPATDNHLSNQNRLKIDTKNPLLRSGLLLAGAKRSAFSGNAGRFDGIVTSEEILGMNLKGTRMVVLSACDTGLGEVRSGEGVFGLRRAFTHAGAKSLVMSMWKVPDLETKELMVQFYRNIKSGSMNRCQALRQAALAQMEIVRKRYGHANPRYWGAFVFMGQP